MATLVESGFRSFEVLLERKTDDAGLTYDLVTMRCVTVTADGTTVRSILREMEQEVIPAAMKANIRNLLVAAESRLKTVLAIP